MCDEEESLVSIIDRSFKRADTILEELDEFRLKLIEECLKDEDEDDE
jgi:hypothetical protein